jgi:twitching motility protein PilT
LRTIRDLLDRTIEKGASDLHIEAGNPPILRLHGSLVPEGSDRLRPEETQALVQELCPERYWKELQEVGGGDFAVSFDERARFRVSVFRERGHLGASLRLLPSRFFTFEEIGLPGSIREFLTRPRGLVLVTGPTGSGKTTTLATMIDWINENDDRHIVTIEDPIEYHHRSKKSLVTQREVGTDVPTFSEAMRRVLRMDPDVILLGEMRDLATISAAITAAETGHLVFGTLHTTGASRTVDRIVDVYPPDQQEQIRTMLSVSLLAVVSQVLLPRADGKGRVAAFEVMVMTPAIENHIRKNESFKILSAIQTGKRLGMSLLDEHLFELGRRGVVSREEALAFATLPNELAARLGAPLPA